ncbi:MAG: tRNA (guanosine(46)-N7)-methyltransferase TrmB [Burkholderiaceae bacterium]|nr:tRNA (guanosine(46)-N7)-methyltransferase TrmB [Burkholderiaceae bacterium]
MSPTPAPTAPDASDAAPPEGVAHPRTIRSFVRRAGRTTIGQNRALEQLGPRFLLPYTGQPLDFAQAWGRTAPNILEIGFGMGEATAHIAALMPQNNFLCCEVHEPGVGALLKRIGELGLENIRILAHDAVEVIDHMLPPQSLDGVHIFFPDPWHKLRHNKRRLIQPALVQRLAQRLKPGGYLHCATDWEPYARQMLDVLGAEPLLSNAAPDGAFAPRPDYRPPTKFERRGLRLGHGVWDLVFRRQTITLSHTLRKDLRPPEPDLQTP